MNDKNEKKVPLLALWVSKREGCYTGKFDREVIKQLKEAGITSFSQLTDCKLIAFVEKEKRSEKAPDMKAYALVPQDSSPEDEF